MDDNQQEILDNLEEKEPRSRLAPYRDLILELRRRNRTYREILQILSDHCQIQVSISTLHDFLRSQRRTESKKKQQATEQNSSNPNNGSPTPTKISVESPDTDNIQQRIIALKQRPTPNQINAPRFSYDSNRPLLLPTNMKKS
jgi:IS30 family transposase